MPNPVARQFQVQVDGKVYTGSMEDLRIDSSPRGIDYALVNNPMMLVWWGELEVRAKELLEELENARNELHAELYAKYEADFQRAIQEGGRPPTVDRIKSAIILDPRHKSLARQIIKARRDVGLLMTMRTAILHRKDSVLELARNRRSELQSLTQDVVRKGDSHANDA